MWKESIDATIQDLKLHAVNANHKRTQRLDIVLEHPAFDGTLAAGLPGGKAVLKGLQGGTLKRAEVPLGGVTYRMECRTDDQGESPSAPFVVEYVRPAKAVLVAKDGKEDEDGSIVMRLTVETKWTNESLLFFARQHRQVLTFDFAKSQTEMFE